MSRSRNLTVNFKGKGIQSGSVPLCGLYLDFIHSSLKSSEKDRWDFCLPGAYNLVERQKKIEQQIMKKLYVVIHGMKERGR